MGITGTAYLIISPSVFILLILIEPSLCSNDILSC